MTRHKKIKRRSQYVKQIKDCSKFYLDLRMKNECLKGRSCSVKLLPLIDIMKSISSRSHLMKDSCIRKQQRFKAKQQR